MPEPSKQPVLENPVGERRIAVRYGSSQETPCHFASLDKIACRWAKVRNISQTGVSLWLSEPFDVGQQLVIELPSKTANATGVTAHVVHVQRTDEAWLIGCAFQQALTDGEFKALS